MDHILSNKDELRNFIEEASNFMSWVTSTSSDPLKDYSMVYYTYFVWILVIAINILSSLLNLSYFIDLEDSEMIRISSKFYALYYF